MSTATIQIVDDDSRNTRLLALDAGDPATMGEGS